MLTPGERIYHDKLRKAAEQLRDHLMAGAPVEVVAAQLGYHAIMAVFALEYPGLEVGHTRSQTLDSRAIAASLSLMAVHLLEGMPPELQTISFQAVTRGMVNAFGSDPSHPMHPLYLKHMAQKGAANDGDHNN